MGIFPGHGWRRHIHAHDTDAPRDVGDTVSHKSDIKVSSCPGDQLFFGPRSLSCNHGRNTGVAGNQMISKFTRLNR